MKVRWVSGGVISLRSIFTCFKPFWSFNQLNRGYCGEYYCVVIMLKDMKCANYVWATTYTSLNIFIFIYQCTLAKTDLKEHDVN